jgi:hypothetical protein
LVVPGSTIPLDGRTANFFGAVVLSLKATRSEPGLWRLSVAVTFLRSSKRKRSSDAGEVRLGGGGGGVFGEFFVFEVEERRLALEGKGRGSRPLLLPLFLPGFCSALRRVDMLTWVQLEQPVPGRHDDLLSLSVF